MEKMMKDWQKTLVLPTATLRDTIQALDNSALQIALVVDAERKLLGTVTDGDIRRAILKGLALESLIQNVMNTTPTVLRENASTAHILNVMKRARRHHIPLLNPQGIVVNLAVLDELIQTGERQNSVVLMAGGLGTRLRPLTEHCPKPLLKVGNKPVLQTIIEGFREQGFTRFYLSVNYKAEMIEAYFGDGSAFDVNIQYLHEKDRLGTAGALTLLPDLPTEPLIVMNGDLLTKVDYRHLLDFHLEHQAIATMCVREYDFQVPYGVVQIDNHRILGIQEKPIQRFFVNAGIYVLQPSLLSLIPKETFFDMPTLFEKALAEKRETVVFPIREYWIDIGQMADLERAKIEFFAQDE
ncbi:NTP transferase domain-containing protein [Beggiatoa leptomitoformis]|uniref:NTP transferase domain-containing protein n=2 Tax=Beggiatoa leptomitoformis TaxID=288004 RepID=A0A2N9YHX6_9GAMM|nr:NTP transferase domain-containing protein [Beggiatoa leptomitoformis]AUI70132.2 NTP transferase domain-containing protein [Beggiatoa leptomitoformis]